MLGVTNNPPYWWDAHLHLQGWGNLAGAFLDHAEAQGIRQFLCNGSCAADWPEVAALSQQFPQVIPAFGLHPWDAAEASADWLDLLRQCLQATPSAVGEIGLDRCHLAVPFDTQERVFMAQIREAKKRDRPMMVHCVRAGDWLLQLFKAEPPARQSVVFHGFTGSELQVAEFSRKYDAYFSIGQAILNRPSPKFVAAIRRIPANRLFIETDLVGTTDPKPKLTAATDANEALEFPEAALLPKVANQVAEVRGMNPSELAALTWENGQNFLRHWRLR